MKIKKPDMVIVCTSLGNADSDCFVLGAQISRCSECMTPVLISPVTQKKIKQEHCLLICEKCFIQVENKNFINLTDEQIAEIPPSQKTKMKCPKCGIISYNVHDILQRYCGGCHLFWGDMKHG